jgi:hypothetical protein
LQNASKRAGSKARIEMTPWRDGVELRFTVRDDGLGLSTSCAGKGLENMCRRLSDLGGRFTMGAAPGAGVVVEGAAPVPPKQTGARSKFALGVAEMSGRERRFAGFRWLLSHGCSPRMVDRRGVVLAAARRPPDRQPARVPRRMRPRAWHDRSQLHDRPRRRRHLCLASPRHGVLGFDTTCLMALRWARPSESSGRVAWRTRSLQPFAVACEAAHRPGRSGDDAAAAGGDPRSVTTPSQ